MPWTEWVGYTGSVLIAVSLLMNNIRRLRWINLAGATVFTVYGFIVKAYPVVVLNAFIVAVNLFYLLKMYRQRDYFSLLPLDAKSSYRDRFLEFYRDDITQLFPDFDEAHLAAARSAFVLRNLMPVGLFVYEPATDGAVDIQLDYVVPHYRDFKNAHFLFAASAEEFRKQGYRTFRARSTVDSHQQYLQQIGFQRDANDPTLFHRSIATN